MHLNEVSKYLGKLMHADQIRAQRERATVYYSATAMEEKDHADILVALED